MSAFCFGLLVIVDALCFLLYLLVLFLMIDSLKDGGSWCEAWLSFVQQIAMVHANDNCSLHEP